MKKFLVILILFQTFSFAPSSFALRGIGVENQGDNLRAAEVIAGAALIISGAYLTIAKGGAWLFVGGILVLDKNGDPDQFKKISDADAAQMGLMPGEQGTFNRNLQLINTIIAGSISQAQAQNLSLRQAIRLLDEQMALGLDVQTLAVADKVRDYLLSENQKLVKTQHNQ